MGDRVHFPNAGCLVEYIEGNAPQIAMVTEEQGGRLRLLLPNRRETRLNASRLLPWHGPACAAGLGRDAAIKLLEEHRARRESLSAAIDPLALWEMAQGELERADAAWFAELFSSEPDIDTVAAYGRALLACKSHFKFSSPDFEIYSEETVARRLAEQEAAREREALVLGGADFFRLLWDVFTKKRTLPQADTAEYPAPAIQERLKGLLKAKIISPEAQGDDVLWKSLTKGLPDVQYLALHLAEAWQLVPPHYNFWLDRADYAAGDGWWQPFEADVEAVLHKVAALHTQPLEATPFISIDSATTRDVDDAFYIEPRAEGGFELTIALACPPLCWDFDSALDKAVMRRATSIYLPEGTCHMMPELLGAESLSLLAGAVRPALCVHCTVDATGLLVACQPSVRVISLAANLCYTDCEAVLEGELDSTNPATAYAAQLALGDQCAALRQQARIADGAVVMDRPDVHMELKGQGADLRVLVEEDVPAPRAQLLVAEMMILASTAMAAWAVERNIPMLFRTQDVALPKELAGIWTEPAAMTRVMRALIPSSLDVCPKRHAALGVPAYAPLTSPLRRYPDLINTAQVAAFLQTGAPRFAAASLPDILFKLNMYLEAAGQVQRFRPRYWKLLYFRQQGDAVWWDAVITEENDHVVSVSLPAQQLFVRGKRALFGERTNPGTAVRVRLGKINPLYNDIALLEVQEA
jgi:exoribonuclease II